MMLEGRILAVHSAWCVVWSQGRTFRCALRGRLRKADSEVLAGDLVEISHASGDTWVIERVHPRRNALVRPPVANVDQVVLVTAVTAPPADHVYIDTILVHLEAREIDGLICINKCDVEEPSAIARLQEVYRRAGYPCVVTSAVTGQGLGELASRMEGKTTVLAGASGVGKSKIISSMLGMELLTGDLSKHGRGRHTTKWVTLFQVGSSGFLADTPGFSKIDPVDCEPHELSYYFREMAGLAPKCRFPRCLHMSESGCKVKEALDRGDIAPQRYESYLELLEECIERMKHRYE